MFWDTFPAAPGVQLAPQPAFGAIAIEIDRDDAET
jgi:hypothetical protein